MSLALLIVGVLLLAVVALLLRGEPDARVRVAAATGAAIGFVLAFLIAVLFGKGVLAGAATGALGGAALALVLIGQWRMLRRVSRGGR
jgi:hypothetical protein